MDSHSTDLRDPVMKIKNSTVLFSKDFFATYDSQYEYALAPPHTTNTPATLSPTPPNPT